MLRILNPLIAALCCCVLAACNEAGPVGLAAVGHSSAGGVPVAMLSLEGAPPDVASRLAGAMAGEAQARDLRVVTAAANPRYSLKGYVTAYPVEKGTAFAWVWDVFDNEKRRAQRLTGTQTVRQQGTEPWAQIDDRTIALIAGASMEGVAAFLAGGQDAVAARPGPAQPSEGSEAPAQ